ncbi:MAG: radical SAM protein [Candidatus Thermoplasmatota archaeon]
MIETGYRYSYNKPIVLQWHLTNRCNLKCKHCYMHDDPNYIDELKNELCFEECIKLIDDFHELLKFIDMNGRINFTGGDPLLKKEIYKLIEYARKKGIFVGILGNPDLLSYKVCKKLKSVGLLRYQISIDGMEKTHDSLRKKGAFRKAIKGIRLLNKVGIPSVVMFTLSKRNACELIDVIRLAAKENVKIFDFARLVPIGSGINMLEDMLEPKEYRSLLLNVLEEYRKLNDSKCETYFGRKESLWALVYKELGLMSGIAKSHGGCSVGKSLITVMPDGKVYPCRRLPIQLGKFPEESIKEIFISSKVHSRLSSSRLLVKCRECELLTMCRGCMGVAFAVSGNPFAPDPQCWKE